MNDQGRDTRSIEEILAAARTRLARVEPEELATERKAGAVIVDIRPIEQRTRDGALLDAIVIDRNEGYQSSLAAALLRDVGLHRATDLVGGFQAVAQAHCTRDALTSQAPVPSATPRPGS